MKKMPKAHYLTEIHKHFPDLTYKKARIIRHGWDHDVVVLDNTWVFRFTKNQDYMHVLRKEIAVINWLKKQTKIALPDYKYIAKDGSFGAYPMLPGRELRKHVLKTFTFSEREAIAQELGEFLSLLHSIPVATAQRWGVKEGAHTRLAYQKRQQQIKKVLFPRLAAKEIQWIEAQYEAFMALSWDFKPVLIHSDFIHHHIFVDVKKRKVSGLIDFADVEIGDPSRDFAGMWEYGETFVEAMFSHYKGPIDSDFLQRSKLPHMYYPVNEMLEVLVNPNAHWSMSFEKSRETLARKMKQHPLS
jgi:aminoglycoside 2''-phosphotransferase